MKPTSRTTWIYLIRHGLTLDDRAARFRGRLDVGLSPSGLAQAEATGLRLRAERRFSAIYTSPLSRARQTAERISAYTGARLVVEGRLAELDYGAWQGMGSDEVAECWPDLAAMWLTTPHQVKIPGGESLIDASRRATEAIAALAETYAGQAVLVVSHSVINRLILLRVLGLDLDQFWKFRQSCCAINVFAARNGEYELFSINDTGHLQPTKTRIGEKE